jgi:hypothetical protein
MSQVPKYAVHSLDSTEQKDLKGLRFCFKTVLKSRPTFTSYPFVAQYLTQRLFLLSVFQFVAFYLITTALVPDLLDYIGTHCGNCGWVAFRFGFCCSPPFIIILKNVSSPCSVHSP